MAQRSSRSNKRTSRKQPELRTGGGRTAKAQRAEARNAAVTRTGSAGPIVRMRPAGPGGVLLMLVLAWLGVLAVVAVGKWFEQVDTFAYPDSLWLYASFGVLAVAPALGNSARSRADVDWWGAQALLVPLGLLLAELFLGPECPDGGGCAALGARGALGTPWSVGIVVAFAIGAWLFARLAYARARNTRPASGRVRAGATAVSIVMLTVFLGGPLAAGATAIDILTRDSASYAQRAEDEVARNCFGLADEPKLEARPAPTAIYDGWTSVAVRRVSENRPGIGTSKLPTNWDDLNTVHPYEALVAFSGDGQSAALSCQRVSPDAGKATTDDIKPNADPESNPMAPLTTGSQFFPQFYTQGPKKDDPADAAAAKKKTATAAKTAATKKAAASKAKAAKK